MNSTVAFGLSYLGSVFGEAGSVGLDGEGKTARIAAYSHTDIPANSDGTIPYAAALSWDDNSVSMYICDDLPTELFYQLYGYATINNIEIE